MSDTGWDWLDGAGLELQLYRGDRVHRERDRALQDAQATPGPFRHAMGSLETVGKG